MCKSMINSLLGVPSESEMEKRPAVAVADQSTAIAEQTVVKETKDTSLSGKSGKKRGKGASLPGLGL